MTNETLSVTNRIEEAEDLINHYAEQVFEVLSTVALCVDEQKISRRQFFAESCAMMTKSMIVRFEEVLQEIGDQDVPTYMKNKVRASYVEALKDMESQLNLLNEENNAV